jgi:hypothetical protein
MRRNIKHFNIKIDLGNDEAQEGMTSFLLPLISKSLRLVSHGEGHPGSGPGPLMPFGDDERKGTL